ncbi:MAG: hypothetical protein INR71_11645, partial [Terriglobus roseus]|nr:hypothetical protein [Terriglobus roseus]
MFTYPDDELMSAAWRHPAFSHIQSKWMYIALSMANGRGVEGAGMIPVQDDWGNLLGGSTPSSPPRARNSETFSREAIPDVDEDALSTHQAVSVDGDVAVVDASRPSSTEATRSRGSLEAAPDLVENGSGQSRVDGLDMSRVLMHLDRIQTTMEELLSARRQTSGVVRVSEQPTAADFSTLTASVNELQRSVTAQSELYRKILERQDSPLSSSQDDERSPVSEGNARPTTSGHSRGLESVVEELRAVRDTFSEHAERVEAALASRPPVPPSDEEEELGSKLDQVNDHLRVLREWTEFDSEHLQELLQLQRAANDTPSSSSSTSSAVSTNELAALNNHLNQIRLVLEQQQQQQLRLPSPNDRAVALSDYAGDLTSSPGTGDARFLLAALAGHLSKVQAVTEQNARHVASLRDHHAANARQTHDILAALRAVTANNTNANVL